MKESSTHNSGNDFSNPLEEKYQNLTFDFGVYDKNENKALLKAPNGRASNLSAEQHLLVRTPAFKAWFGDWEEAYRTGNYDGVSKVLDENGEPLVVYHGTNIHFNIFDLNKTYRGGLGTGFYFTENREKADAYGSFLKEVFINVKNPILVTGSNSESDLRDILKLSSTATEKEIREKSIILNYDGVVKSSKRSKFSEICVFTPTQIKLADGTNTTFDSSNPDIRFAEGGKIPTTRKMVVIIRNIKNPNDTDAKGIANKYKGAYKRIYDILNEDAVFVEHTHEEEVMRGNDYFLFFDFVPDYNAIQQIKNIKNVEVIDENVDEFIANFNTTYADGGQTETLIAPNEKSNPVKEFSTWYKNWYKPISGKINIMFSVPNELHLEEFLAMITEENVVIMDLFEKIDQNIDAKPFMRQICEKADELGITIYLEPNPRYKYFAENTEKRNKVNKQYLFDYYFNFGFEPTSDKRFMKRTPKMKAEIPNILFKKGGQINIDDYMLLTYHEIEGNWFVAKNEVYLWLYDDMDAGKKLQSGEYDYVLFPPTPPIGMAFKKNFVPPLLQVWTKKYQKEHKGSEKLMAVIRAWYDEKNHKLYLLMMTTRKDLQRKGIISSMIKELRKQFNVEQEDVIFDDPTEQGKSVMESKKFDKGGEVESITFYTRTYADGTTQRFSVEDYEKNVLPTLPNDGKFHLGGETEILLAPNGKPSNLTPEQWHLVRTPEFKNWFGDWENDPENASKVVDENGEPLVVWHGGMVRNIFDKSKIGKNDEGWFGYGFYFTEDKSFANSWGESKPYFISIRNPFEIIKKGISLVNPFYNNSIIETDNKIKEGYDGSIFKLSKPNEYVVFYEFATQIKLADGSNTNFDPSNPDIRFKKGGEVDYKQLELERIAAKYKDLDFDLSPSPQKKVRLAPNGKPSKLNEVQYKAVRSANFINWFGDWQKAYKTGDYTNVSKCIDENGEPLIVYRGHSKKEADQYTKVFNYQVNRFSQNRNPNRFAFYFTESYYVANQYGGGDDEGIVTPYFLNIREMCDFTPSNPEYPNETEFYLPYADKYDKIWIESLVKIKEGKVTFANYKDELPEAVVSFFEKMQGRVTERNFEGFKNLIEKKANYKMQEIVDENEKYYGSNATLKQVIKMIDPNMPLSIMDTNDTHYTNFFQDYFNKNFPVFFFFIHHISFLYWNLPENTDIILKNEMVKRGFTGGKFLETTYAENSPTGTEMVYFNFYPEDVKLADGSNYTFRPDVKDTDYGDGGMIMIYPD